MNQPVIKTEREPLLTPTFLKRLERLDILSRKILRGKMQGERRSKKRGQSVEFADFRNYVSGDDLRFIDWNLYARLDKLFLRLFMEEEDLTVSIVLDTTASMNHGNPNKLRYMKQLAAALSYISLIKYNRLSLFTFTDDITASLPNLRGRRPMPHVINFLETNTPEITSATQPGDFSRVCKSLARHQQHPGVIVLISDFFDKGELGDALNYLTGATRDVYALQLLSPEEVDPRKGDLLGDLRLQDIEDGDITEVSITPELIDRYQANLEAYCNHVRTQCSKRDILYLLADTSVPVETLILKYLRQRGLVG
ncbi:DUF58 domain-containing protein [Poriferisphaera sp. WC338]|uniref:DUF58 domain-containing protein n=1 Tax=Poriferisphaera sp. WC338 TaxID=3425129 RepID=UPI003D81B020